MSLMPYLSADVYKRQDMYKNFAETAKAEGFAKIAFQMEQVAKLETHHEERYLKLLENVRFWKPEFYLSCLLACLLYTSRCV